MRNFPADCPYDCIYLERWDMSVDDWASYCELLNKEIDDCDMEYFHYPCPLDEEDDMEEEEC